ncbi:MAG: Na-K-Cl cotransporter [Nitrospirota bacterium]
MPEKEKTGYQFGTFKGVFTPSILTILGVIMYLRFGWVIGNVGLVSTLIIVTISTSITFFTALSVSALSTNMRVKGGGAYYIISRTLGIETGAAIGLPLYLAQALGISFYIVGFAESVVQINPLLTMKEVAIATLILMSVLALKSADIALKSQFFILLLIALSLFSFFMGTGQNVTSLPPDTIVPEKESFWMVFAVFFPAVTGILSGLSMSGDLKNPEKSIPWGTLAAVAFSYAVYMAIPVFFARVIQDSRILLVDSMAMYKTARWGELILAGLWGAALSSAMGSLLGAPRTLQAIARDGIVFRFIGHGFGKNQEPRIAVFLSFLIALAGILAGDLNVIAPVLSMFFLTTYGLLNLSAGFGKLINSPSWRPKFRVHWGISFAGSFGCFAAMFMINPGATFIAIFVSIGVYALMKRRRMKARWGDLKYGILMLMVQFGLYKLAAKRPNIETWRPNILVLSGSPTSRWHLIEMANALSHGYGLLTVAAILPEKHVSFQRKESMETTIRNYLEEKNVKAMVKVYPADTIINGISALIKGYGFGPIEPNTVLIGEIAGEENITPFAEMIRMMHENRRNIIIVKEGQKREEGAKEKKIDIWWGQKGNNAGLVLALAHLLSTSPSWKNSGLRLRTVISPTDDRHEIERGLMSFIEQVRLEAGVDAVIMDESGLFGTIRKHSHDSDCVFVGLRPPSQEENAEDYSRYLKNIFQRTQDFPFISYVMASEDLEFKKIFTSL